MFNRNAGYFAGRSIQQLSFPSLCGTNKHTGQLQREVRTKDVAITIATPAEPGPKKRAPDLVPS